MFYKNLCRTFISLFYFMFFLILCSGCSDKEDGFDITMAVDSNRDGQVDWKTDGIEADSWTIQQGAVFLNNCDSDQNTGKPDFADTVVNGEDDLKDLTLIKVRRIKTGRIARAGYLESSASPSAIPARTTRSGVILRSARSRQYNASREKKASPISELTSLPCARMFGLKQNRSGANNPAALPYNSLAQRKIRSPAPTDIATIIVLAQNISVFASFQ